MLPRYAGEGIKDRDDVIAAARSWIGTPYHHQGSMRGVGADCVGFVKGVALEAGLITPELAATLPTDYSRQPYGGQLRRLMGELLVPVPYGARQPADLILIRFAVEPQHIAMITAVDPDYIIHCDREGVVEHRLDSTWRARIARVYRFAGWWASATGARPYTTHFQAY